MLSPVSCCALVRSPPTGNSYVLTSSSPSGLCSQEEQCSSNEEEEEEAVHQVEFFPVLCLSGVTSVTFCSKVIDPVPVHIFDVAHVTFLQLYHARAPRLHMRKRRTEECLLMNRTAHYSPDVSLVYLARENNTLSSIFVRRHNQHTRRKELAT